MGTPARVTPIRNISRLSRSLYKMKRIGVTLEMRLMAKVDRSEKHGPNGDCWNWTAYADGWGYGRIIVDGSSRLAHRISYMLFNGDVAGDSLVLHKCDVAHCVNPDHLYIGTHADNVNDAYKRNRYPSRKGMNNGHSKLSEGDVRTIRILWGNGWTYKRLAKRFKVTPGAICHARRGLTWKHLQMKRRTVAK